MGCLLIVVIIFIIRAGCIAIIVRGSPGVIIACGNQRPGIFGGGDQRVIILRGGG